jgi:hypothetical protein
LILWNLAARLEAAPFQNGLQNAFFRKLLMRCATQIEFLSKTAQTRGLSGIWTARLKPRPFKTRCQARF